MFGFLKKKKEEVIQNKIYNLVSAVDGRVLNLSEVPDVVFAEKLVGDGVAIDPTGDIIVSPADGELTLVFNTKHAFALTLDNGIELLVHVGIDTVSLMGEGFEQLAEAGIRVKAGTPILKIDREFIRSKGFSLVTPVLITNTDITSSIITKESIDAIAGKTVVVEYSI